jgi:hypothetical protein
MISPLLRHELEPIAKSHRQAHLWRGLATCWAAVGVLGLGFIAAFFLADWWSPNTFLVLLVGGVVASVAVWFRSRTFDVDFEWIAHEIEKHDPRLNTLLLAALEQQPDPGSGHFNYLQYRVIREALDYNDQHAWAQRNVEDLFFARCAHHFALILFLGVMAGLAFMRPAAPEAALAHVMESVDGVEVTPGDASVEKGSTVVVLAKFEEPLPAKARLVFGATTNAPKSIQLVKNLNDPVFGGTLTDIQDDVFYRIEFGDGRTRDFRLSVFEHPRLERADAELDYPAYTGMSHRSIEDTRRVTAVEGTELEYRFHLNKSVTTAELVRKGDDVGKDDKVFELIPDPGNTNIYVAKMTLAESRKFELRLVDSEGRENKLPPQINIRVHQNEAAKLKLKFPSRDMQVSPLEEMTLEAEITDDFGLKKYGFAYSLGADEPKFVELGNKDKKDSIEKRIVDGYLLSMEDLNAEPDQLVSYFVWAEDVGPDGEPRRTFSDMFFAEIRPFDQIFRPGDSSKQEQKEKQQQQQGGQAGELIELQKQIMVATWKLKRREASGEKAPKVLPDVAVVRESQEIVISQADEAGAKIEDPEMLQFLEKAKSHMSEAVRELKTAEEEKDLKTLSRAMASERAAYQALLKLQSKEFQVSKQKQKQQGKQSGKKRQQRQLNQLEMKAEEDRYETERQAVNQEQNDPQKREQLQVLNRLRELAQRQQDLNKQIKELQTALQEADTAKEKEELRKQLKRLQEEQRQLREDVDELQQRMEEPKNRDEMAEASEKLEQIRENIRRAEEDLEQGKASQALASGTRAEESLKELKEEFRKKTANEFEEEMREMRSGARELAQTQESIGERMENLDKNKRKTLSDDGERQKLEKELELQKERLEKLKKEMRDVSDIAEVSEPILHRHLYDTLRRADQKRPEEKLENAHLLLSRNFLDDARNEESKVQEDLDDIKRGVEKAAESVLGDEIEALKLARQELERLSRDLERELSQRDPHSTNQMDLASLSQPDGGPAQFTPNSTNRVAQAGGGDQREPREGQKPGQGEDQKPGQGEGQKPGQGEGQKPGQQEGQKPGQQEGQKPGQGEDQKPGQGEGQKPGQGEGQKPGQGEGQKPGQGEGQKPGQGEGQKPGQQEGQQPGQRQTAGNPNGGGGGLRDFFTENQNQELRDSRGPLTGDNYVDWSDRLRDVEEMLDVPELREQVARVRGRARTVRAEFKRHGEEPKWDLVRSQVYGPLIELRDDVIEELARRDSDSSLTPIDRDPVPPRYAEKVRRYYEELGSSEAGRGAVKKR